jgi:phage-related minor tail protein
VAGKALTVTFLGDTSNLEKATDQVNDKFAKFGKMAAAAGAAVGAAALAAGKGLFEVGKTFDQVNDTIRVGTGATGKALKGLQDDAKAVGRNVPAEFADIGTAVADLNTRLGLTGKPLQDMSARFLNLSRITGTDLATNIADITRVFGDWGIKSRDQAGAMDKLFRASQATGAGIDSLSQQVVQFGAPLRQMGFSFEQSLALFGKFEKEGVNIETVMSGMRQGLGRMAKAGEAPAETFRRVSEEIKNAGSVGEANAISLELFGQRAGPDMAAAIREGKFELDDLVNTITNGTDTINAAAKDTESFAEQWQMFKNRVLVGLEPIASKLFSAIGKGVEWLNRNGVPEKLIAGMGQVVAVSRQVASAMGNVARWIEENKVPITAVAGLIATLFIPHWIALGTTATIQAAKNLAAWSVVQGGAIKAAAVHSAQVVGMVARWAFMGVQSLLHAAKVAAAWVVAMGPIGWATAAVVGLVAVVIANWDKVKKWTVDTWNAVSSTVTTAWDQIVKGVKTAAGAVWSFLKRWGPLILAVITGPFGMIVYLVVKYWDQIKAATGAAWNWVTTRFQQATAFIRGLWDGFWTFLRDLAVRVFEGVRDAITRGLTAVRDAFTRTVDWVRDTWKKIEGHARRPIQFVVDVVYNRGIRPVWNGIARVFGLGRLDEVRMARGGVIPGFEPGRDTVPAVLSRGEGVLVPEAVRALGPDFVHTANRVFSGGRARSDGTETFAHGGIAGIFTRPGKAVRHLFERVLGDADRIPGGGMLRDALAKLPLKVIDAVIKKIKGLFTGGGGIGGRSGPGGWQWQMAVLRKVFPGLQLISGFRPGAITATGNRSYHALGRAVDIPPRMDVFNWIRANFGAAARELIFSPAGGRQVWNGRPHYYTGITRANHWDHVHWSMADGGLVTSPTMALLGEDGPEALVPLTRPRRAQQVMDQAGIGGDKHYHLTVYNAANSNIDIRTQFRRMELLESV